MHLQRYLLVLLQLFIFNFVFEGVASSSDLPVAVRSEDLLSSSIAKRSRISKNSTSLDKSFSGAVLLNIAAQVKSGNTTITGEVKIICTKCYTKGNATAQLTIAENFNISQALQTFENEVENEVEELTNATVAAIKDYLQEVDLDGFDFPTLNDTNFDLSIPDIPECNLQLQFDGLELYMEIDTVLSAAATYDLNLYRSKSILGVASGQQEIGIIFSIDLILSVSGSIDISSGFHIKLNDGVFVDITLFGQNISSITNNGGHFEFLPVSVHSDGVVLTALLRIGVQAGINLAAPPLDVLGVSVATASSGAAAGIFMNVAEFITNITAPSATSSSDDDSSVCVVVIEEVYSMAIGAQAGATLAILGHTWGPTPETSTVLFYTTLASQCIGNQTSTTKGLTARAASSTGLTTTTLTTKITLTGTQCLSTGLMNCPVSLQTTVKNTITSTLVTSVPSGSTATFPATTQNSVTNTIAFGKNAKALESTSGTPTSFVPTTSPSSTSTINITVDGKTVSVNKKLVIGLSVGLGVPFLIGLLVGIICCVRRRKIAAQKERSPSDNGTPDFERDNQQPPSAMKKSPTTTTTEILT